MKKYLNNKLAIVLFTFPAILFFTVMVFYPIVQTFLKSFTSWDGLTAPIFTGLENYTELFQDEIFHTAIKNGLLFAAIITVVQISIGTVLALAVADIAGRLKNALRISYFMPVFCR